jgi:hypothetical protein
MNDQTLGSYQGIPCHHWDDELPLIATLLRVERPMLVVEVGTMYGGFAAFLADTVAPWNATVLTFDHVMYEGLEKVCAPRKNLFFVRGDVFSDFGASLLIGEISAYEKFGVPTLLYCDGGAKRKELFAYGHLASLVGVHDYGTEVSEIDCAQWAEKHNFAPLGSTGFSMLQEQHGGYFVSRFWLKL